MLLGVRINRKRGAGDGVFNMRFGLLATAAAAAVLASAAPAGATVFLSFAPGAATPDTGYSVIDTFDTLAGVVASGVPGQVQIKFPPSDSSGAPPANSSPSGTNYLSVLAGGIANIALSNVSAFQFDWGSIDAYNTLTIFTNFGSGVVIPGSLTFPNAANGDQFAAGTNGRFTVFSDNAGEYFTGIQLESSTNSFEIDNLAVAAGVPEPATWGMMILGFGAAGSLIRRRRAAALTA